MLLVICHIDIRALSGSDDNSVLLATRHDKHRGGKYKLSHLSVCTVYTFLDLNEDKLVILI